MLMLRQDRGGLRNDVGRRFRCLGNCFQWNRFHMRLGFNEFDVRRRRLYGRLGWSGHGCRRALFLK